jgi:hypothetical protein
MLLPTIRREKRLYTGRFEGHSLYMEADTLSKYNRHNKISYLTLEIVAIGDSIRKRKTNVMKRCTHLNYTFQPQPVISSLSRKSCHA